MIVAFPGHAYQLFNVHNAPAPDRMNARVMVLVELISLHYWYLSPMSHLLLGDVPGDWQQANVSLVQKHGSFKIQLFQFVHNTIIIITSNIPFNNISRHLTFGSILDDCQRPRYCKTQFLQLVQDLIHSRLDDVVNRRCKHTNLIIMDFNTEGYYTNLTFMG